MWAAILAEGAVTGPSAAGPSGPGVDPWPVPGACGPAPHKAWGARPGCGAALGYGPWESLGKTRGGRGPVPLARGLQRPAEGVRRPVCGWGSLPR